MAGAPKQRAKREALKRDALADINPIDLLGKLSDRDMELIAGAWLQKRGIDPRSLAPSRAQMAEMPKFDLPWKPVFLLALRDTGNVRSASTAAGVSRQRAYDQRITDETFATWWDICLEEAIDLLEMSAWALASRLDGPMIRFLLMSHRPEVYNIKADITHRGDKDAPIEVNHTHQVAVYLPHNGRDEVEASRVAQAPDGVRLLTEQERLELAEPGSSAIEADWAEQEDEDGD